MAELKTQRLCELALVRARGIVAEWGDLPRRAAGLRELAARLESAGGAEVRALARLCGEETPRAEFEAVLVELERRSGRRVAQRVTDAECVIQRDAGGVAQAAMPLVVVCAAMRSAFNVGSVFRAVECLGAAEVWGCEYTAGPGNPAARRAAMGTADWVPWRAFGHATDAIAALREKHFQVVALETVEDAVPLEDFTWPFPCGLLLGHERFGLGRDVVSAADARVKITMRGRKNSLNVAAALAVALHAARVQWENI